MSLIKLNYSTTDQVIITLDGLKAAECRESSYIDNSVNRYMDVFVGGQIRTNKNNLLEEGSINVYAYASSDEGDTFTSNATGVDSWIELSSVAKKNLHLVGVIHTDSTPEKTYNFGPWSVGEQFNGCVPQFWGLVFENNTGSELFATGNQVLFEGIYLENA